MDAEHEFVEQLRTATETYLQSADEWEASYAKYYCLHVSTNTGLPSLSLETPSAASWFSTSSVPNQISGWTYDASGNVTAVGSMSRSFTYDAENRQTGATISGASYTYAYDGVGNRISSTDSGQTTVYAFDASGNLAVEYGQTGFGLCGTATCYLTVDHLGSTRLMTDSSGAVTRRFDYLPFGEQLPASTNNRSSAGYLATADQLRAKFTGQQHDGTGLDFFNARYLSGAQGRFTSADPGNAGAILGDPQSWNGYAYVNNNPLTYTDPSGMDGGGFSLCAGGPVACGIGIGIDIGIVLWKIFGSGGGGSARPTVPNTQPGGDPWSEKVPYRLGGGSNADPFVIKNIIKIGAGTPAQIAEYQRALAYLKGSIVARYLILRLERSSNVYTIKFIGKGADAFDPSTRTIFWDPWSSLRMTSGGCQTAAVGLGHEMGHAFHFDTDPQRYVSDFRNKIKFFGDMEEKRTGGLEDWVAWGLGENTRNDHFGYPKTAPNSTARVCQ